MSCRSLRNDAIADDSAAEDGTSQSAAGTDHAAGFAAGFAVTLRHTPTCAEHLRATEGEPIGGDDEWCTAEQISAYFGEMSSHVSPGGIPYRVVDHAGGARILVGDYELYFNGGPGVYELERQLVDPSNPAGVSQPYVEFVNRVIDSLFVPTRHLDGAPTRAAWRRSAQTESRIPGRSPGFPLGCYRSSTTRNRGVVGASFTRIYQGRCSDEWAIRASIP